MAEFTATNNLAADRYTAQLEEITARNTLTNDLAADRYTAMQKFYTGGSSSTSEFDPGSFRMADNAGMTINVNVAGNVQTEQDLADAIRQRILLEQSSGKPILFVGGL